MDKKSFFGKLDSLHWIIIPSVLILIGCIRLIGVFSLRDGHHVDEVFSYGYADSYYSSPNLFEAAEGHEPYVDTWVPAGYFFDFISVDDEHRFSYDSVFYNKKDDLCPPFHALMLHTICSLFPGTFSWWYSFVLNLVLFIPTLLLVYLISHAFTDSKLCGCLSMVYFIFSGCGTAGFLYLRVYSLFTMFTLLTFYLFIRLIKTGKDVKSKKKILLFVILILSTFLGAFSHFYYLILAFFFTLFTDIYFLAKKRIADFVSLSVCMLGAVGLFFLIYSPALNILMPFFKGADSAGGAMTYPYHLDLAVAHIRFFMGTMGWYIPFSIALLMYVFGILFFVLICVLLVRLLFRNEEWIKNAVSGFKMKCSGFARIMTSFFGKMNVSVLIAVLSSIAYLLIVPASASIMNMGFVERYFFPAMTLFEIAYVSIITLAVLSVIRSKTGKKSAIIIGAVSLLVVGILAYRSNKYTDLFKMKEFSADALSDQATGKDCFIVINSLRDITWLVPIIKDSDNVYIVYQSAFNYEEVVPSLDEDDVILLLKSGLLTDEGKAELMTKDADTINIVLSTYCTSKTSSEIMSQIQSETGNDYTLVDDYKTFIGTVGIYRCANGS